MALERDDFTRLPGASSHLESLAAAAKLQDLVAQRSRELNVTCSLVDDLLDERRGDSLR